MDQETPNSPSDVVTVNIYDQLYHLRGQNVEYIRQLASVVDDKMRNVATHGTTVDSLRVAVLAALNLADELAQMTEKYQAATGSLSQANDAIRSRTSSLNGLLDAILKEDRRIS